MKAPTVIMEDDSEVELPFTWCICGACRGNGTSSAYLGAITESDREPGGSWEDPDDFRRYMAGRYDRECDRCEGTGKVKEVDRRACDPALLKEYDDQVRGEREDRALEAAERRMGA